MTKTDLSYTVVKNDTCVVGDKYNSKMIHRWVKGLELIQQSGVEYDYVFVVRPDLFFDPGHPIPPLAELLSNIDTNCLYAGWSDNCNETKRLNDVHFIATFDSLKKIINDETSTLWNNSAEDDWHIWWYSHVTSIGLKVLPVSIGLGRL